VESWPDGRVRVLTSAADVDAPSPTITGGDDWTSHAGEKALPRA
jgi:hypothetical protein